MQPLTIEQIEAAIPPDKLRDEIVRAALAALGSPDEAATGIVVRWSQACAAAVRADLPAAVADALTLGRHPDDVQI